VRIVWEKTELAGSWKEGKQREWGQRKQERKTREEANLIVKQLKLYV
jgi:hypothetical protein